MEKCVTETCICEPCLAVVEREEHGTQAREGLEGRRRLHYNYLYVPSRKWWIYRRASRTLPRTRTRARSDVVPTHSQLTIERYVVSWERLVTTSERALVRVRGSVRLARR